MHTKESIQHFSADSLAEMSDWLKSLRTCAFGLPAEPTEARPGELSQINGNYEDQKKLDEERSAATENTASNESTSKASTKPTANDTANEKTKKSILLLNKQPKNEDNILYCSVEQKQKQKLFRVTVGQSEAAIRCSLQICSSPRSNEPPVRPMNEPDKESPVKHYYLAFTTVSINLLENPARPTAHLYEWNFRNIRRYGCTIDSFSIEVGRKSKSGAGLFLFHTLEGATIFQLLAKHVNDLKNEALSNGGLLMKELAAAADLNGKCRPISTLINIQPAKYEPAKYESTKYDSVANSPSSSSTSIKSSSCTSNESNLSDSAQSNSGDFTSLNEQKNFDGAELIKGIQHKFGNQAVRHHQQLSQYHLSHQKVGEKINSQSLPVARSTNLLPKTKLVVERNGNQNKENCFSGHETIKATTNNPFLSSYRTEITGNEHLNKTVSDATKTVSAKAPLRPPKMDEDEYNDVANNEHTNLPSRLAGNFSGKLLSNFPGHKQMNNKLSSCSVVNLIEDQKLNHLNKLNKSLPQINQIGVVSGSKLTKLTNETIHNQISYSSIISVDASASNLSFSKPNALAKPPRLSKLLLNGEPSKSVTGECVSSEAVSGLSVEGLNEKGLHEKAFNKIDGQPSDEEPIFESRQDLFGYRKEENHYEVADELEADGKETVEKSAAMNDGPANKPMNTDRQMNVDKQANIEKQVNVDRQTNAEKQTNSLLPIDTYELLVKILNQIDEKSLNTTTLKEAIKKAVLTDGPLISSNKTEDEFFEHLLLSNNNDEQATINYCVNDCEYAKIMKKKFMKKTIVEHF